jgi:AraC family transcriptional regulator of adaptative response / DNA-3-methyladenine glycosylase II
MASLLKARAIPGVEVVSKDRYARTIEIDGVHGVIAVEAQYIAWRELREPDAFPAGGIGLLRAMTDAQGKRPTPRELLARQSVGA